jgi:hypothetical protein
MKICLSFSPVMSNCMFVDQRIVCLLIYKFLFICKHEFNVYYSKLNEYQIIYFLVTCVVGL